ncbi:MAG: peptidoglycan DD-metalloendopeptidase family protein [Alphaproteobacteria bacterium]|nr:peptidoglycan DD-metalloendopeptidase family protein [Alphaproteobacteria bacterium]
MRPSKLFFRLAAIVAAVSLLASPASAKDSPDNLVPELDQARHDAIQAARETQQHQAAAAALDRELDLLDRDLAARRRGLDESQPEQAQLLGALERLALHQPDETKASEAPLLSSLDRARSQMLLAATVPALRAEAQALAGEIQGVASLRARIAAKESELAGLRDALPKYRENLAQILAHRAELIRQLLPETGKPTDLAAKPDKTDLNNLIQLADAAAEKRDKALLARARAGLPKDQAEALTLAAADPTRPKDLRPFAAAEAAMLLPAAGTVLTKDQTGGAEAAGQGLHLATPSGAVVVAPFDGQVIYAGPFQPYVLVLIIRHTDGYHSVLAGLGRADSAVGQWVIAGEPVGVMPDAAGQGSGGEIYVELRRNGQPVDP